MGHRAKVLEGEVSDLPEIHKVELTKAYEQADQNTPVNSNPLARDAARYTLQIEGANGPVELKLDDTNVPQQLSDLFTYLANKATLG